MYRIATSLLVFSFLIGCTPKQEVATILHNATIYTVNEDFQVAEAMAIDSTGAIIEIGPEHQIMNAYVSENVVDAGARFVYPGFIDAHSHFLGYGIEKTRLNLVGTTSFEEVIERIENYIVDHPGKWILGRGWDQNDWTQSEFPDNDTLSILFPDHYIALKRIDGHAILVSKNVLSEADIDASSSIQGGGIILGRDGKPTGVLIDEAITLVDKIIPEPSNEEKIQAILKSQTDCIAAGLTSATDAGLSVDEIELLKKLESSGDLKIKLNAMYSADNQLIQSLDELIHIGSKLVARSVKIYADGALGSRGAALLEPYADDTANIGLMITPRDSLKRWAIACKNAGVQMSVHCIGDRGNREVLETMGSVLEGTNDLRWRIEHAQVVHPEDRSLFGQFNIIPSMQPTHATSDMYWVKARLGEKRQYYAYNLKSLMNQNGIIALGTDFPVEEISPINTFYAAVIRKDKVGFPEGGFQMDEALSREEALKGMTIWAAIANFEETSKGSLEAGKQADFVVLDRDIMTCNENQLLETSIIMTWIDGELFYEN